MSRQGFLRGVGTAIVADLVAKMVIACLSGAFIATALFLLAMLRRFQWMGGPALTLLSVGVFLLVLLLGLSLLPRFWTPTGPFGKTFGMAPLMVGISEERNKQVFMSAPGLKVECQKVAKQLYAFVDNERKQIPAPLPGSAGQDPSSPEIVQFNANMQAALQRFTTLYHNMWRRRVEALLVDARAMFFGPLPHKFRFLEGRILSPDYVYQMALALDNLSQAIPARYTEAIHAARVERLRRLRRDGLTLSADLGQFFIARQEAAISAREQVRTTEGESSESPNDSSDAHREWLLNVRLSSETEALFAAQFGGSVLDVLQRLDDVGLTDEYVQRLLAWGPTGLRISSYEIGGLAGVIAALCQQIPYD